MKELLYLKDVVTLRLDPAKCTGCGMCLEVCPRAVLARGNGTVVIATLDACIECGACQQNCPAAALSVRAGVGCAHAVINAALGRTSGACCCVVEPKVPDDPGPSCGPSCGPSGSSGCC
jgi:NAD-dependent dihydropyrimidine dehydrogenase PreA subunit